MADRITKADIYMIKKMTRMELDIAVQWAADEGWNPGLHDSEAFYATDPGGFLIGYLNEEPIATISVVNYDNNFGFLGFYIVKPEYRGKGYGLKIWDSGMEYLRNMNIGLDGVVAQQDKYKKSGFRFAYRNMRYQGVANGKLSENIIPLKDYPFDELVRYDTNLFPAQRAKFIAQWIQQPQGTAYGITYGKKLTGYGVIRKCRKGLKVGPLFADNYNIAEELLGALVSSYNGEIFYLDIPEINSDALRLVNSNKMSMVFETARMYTGKFPEIDIKKIFGITTFELG